MNTSHLTEAGAARDAQTALEALPTGVLIADPTERITFANDLAVALLGQSRKDCVGQTIKQLVTLPRPLGELAGSAAHPRRYFDVVLARPHGEHVPTAMCVSALDTGGYVCLLQPSQGVPVTGADGLQHVDRLIAMGQMVAGFAHEVRNPLAALKSLIENLVVECPENDTRAEDLVRMDRLVRRIEKLVHSSLQFSKPNAPLRQAHDVGTLVQAAVDVLGPRLRETCNEGLIPELEQGLPRVFVDDNQLVQVLIVLLNNALEATQDAKKIVVRARRAERSEPLAEAFPSVLLEVEDLGSGIAPETLARIFDPFFTTKARGTGLGLSIALRLVLENGGQIHVRSRVGRGSVFTVELPAYLP